MPDQVEVKFPVKVNLIPMLEDSNREPAEWRDEISTVASSHNTVTGMLAGFSATIVVLIIGLRFGNNISLGENPPAAVSLGIFSMAFFGYVATGILYSISVERYGNHRFFLFSTASVIYYLSGILSFSAVYPLILLIQSNALQRGVKIMILGGLVGGFLAAAIPLYDLLLIKFRFIIGAFVASVIIGLALYFLPRAIFDVQGSALLPWLLIACAIVVVLAFNLVALTFFIPGLNRDDFYRVTSLVLIALATVTLCFAITVSFKAGS
jgi:hypothetical protein